MTPARGAEFQSTVPDRVTLTGCETMLNAASLLSQGLPSACSSTWT
jgi:hypothetical protein